MLQERRNEDPLLTLSEAREIALRHIPEGYHLDVVEASVRAAVDAMYGPEDDREYQQAICRAGILRMTAAEALAWRDTLVGAHKAGLYRLSEYTKPVEDEPREF